MIDIASRRVVGFALADHLRTELVADALANAVAARDPEPVVIFHSDRGCQHSAPRPRSQISPATARSPARGPQGPVLYNAVAESFFASLKGELTDTRASDPRGSLPGGRGVHRLVQRHPAQRPGLLQAPPSSKMTTTESSGM